MCMDTCTHARTHPCQAVHKTTSCPGTTKPRSEQQSSAQVAYHSFTWRLHQASLLHQALVPRAASLTALDGALVAANTTQRADMNCCLSLAEDGMTSCHLPPLPF